MLSKAEHQLSEISGWGLYPRTKAKLIQPTSEPELPLIPPSQMIARGLGRSYGDAALLTGGEVCSTLDLAIDESFDPETGRLVTSAGTSIQSVISRYLPQGWFPPVVPGTSHVTVGGCVAADIHGKNHHRDGSFIEHVSGLRIMLGSGKFVDCSRRNEPEIFWATAGGMGLTGLISRVEIQLSKVQSAWLVVRHHAARNLGEMMDYFEQPSLDDHYSVAWLDCASAGQKTGRGILITGHHALAADVQKSNPLLIKEHSGLRVRFAVPRQLFGRYFIKLFNGLYYQRQARRRKTFLANYREFFFPLDALEDWNKLYGRRGFLQYQCVIPTAGARQAIALILNAIVRSNHPSTLAVLKKFRAGNEAPLSFPIDGYTLALDFPLRDTLFGLLDRLDEITMAHGGRVYFAKDARLKPEAAGQMYPRLEEWKKLKRSIDPTGRFVSDLSRRLNFV